MKWQKVELSVQKIVLHVVFFNHRKEPCKYSNHHTFWAFPSDHHCTGLREDSWTSWLIGSRMLVNRLKVMSHNYRKFLYLVSKGIMCYNESASAVESITCQWYIREEEKWRKRFLIFFQSPCREPQPQGSSKKNPHHCHVGPSPLSPVHGPHWSHQPWPPPDTAYRRAGQGPSELLW